MSPPPPIISQKSKLEMVGEMEGQEGRYVSAYKLLLLNCKAWLYACRGGVH